MIVLALDSSGLVATVAIVSEETMLAEYTVHYKKTHSQTLLPMLNEITTMVDLDMEKVDAIAVAAGPGSFTGLRIGSATAKGLGLALGKPVIGVPTLEGLAYNLYGTDQLICPMMDARRNQVYTGLYEFEGLELKAIKAQSALGIEEILEEINRLGRKVILMGDGTDVHAETIDKMLKVPYSYAPTHLSRQRAGAIGALGILYYKKGLYEPAAQHEPEYLRLSQAERERAEREQTVKG